MGAETDHTTRTLPIQLQYAIPATSGLSPWGPPPASTFQQQQQQYGPYPAFSSYSTAPSTSGAQTSSSPSKRNVPDFNVPLTPLMRDLDVPSPISSLNTPQKEPDDPNTSK
ncbi:hypothetical protein E2C01_064106 [Portunus trituberculatus]|uniref:Uncharacterized protein n=1 Tax=Portunus trituberculatus TaxID=210409 RepID=A0A5B7HMU8_PORTR|nr:hypothetical protein [Portunus trituberculatus]